MDSFIDFIALAFVYWYVPGVLAVCYITAVDNKHDVSSRPSFAECLAISTAGWILVATCLWVFYEDNIKEWS